MGRYGLVTPEQLMPELRVILRAACRPAKVVPKLGLLDGLLDISECGTADVWAQAICVCRFVASCAARLGDGPYGIAAKMLLGVDAQTRGLSLGRRRLEAANQLQVEVGTFVRHWEASILSDIAVEIYSIKVSPKGIELP